MADSRIYEDIALRTGGDIYLGVVGPVRTGKSTFIKRFMETLVIPRIENVYRKERARDELPQSGSGRTIMTAEPKFVPEEAVTIETEDGLSLSVRLIDCVGYMVPGAVGQTEDGQERMVTTPWFDHEVTMTEAAEEGTHKVIAEHSTIGLVITTDGSVCGLPRQAYEEAEARVIEELLEIGKPFCIVVNSADPGSAEAAALQETLRQRYGVGCVCVNCLALQEADIRDILHTVLGEFPLGELGFFLPPWVDALPLEHPIKQALYTGAAKACGEVQRLRDAENVRLRLLELPEVSGVSLREMKPGAGRADLSVELPQSLYYETISAQSGFAIRDDGDLMALLMELRQVKEDYDRVKDALEEVRATGYGIVMPGAQELHLEEPEIVRQGGRYSVKLRASAPSIHMIRANIETEVSPALGGERSSEELINFLLQSFEGDTTKIWESNIFGKSLYDIAGESLATKIRRMPADAQNKLRETLQRIINEGSGGLICIIL